MHERLRPWVTPPRPLQKPLNEEEFNQHQRRLSDWSCHGDHDHHKRWQVPSYEQALPLGRRHGHLESSRIGTDSLNGEAVPLCRDELGWAVLLNALAADWHKTVSNATSSRCKRHCYSSQ